MPRSDAESSARPDARVMLLEAARDLIRERGFAAMSLDALCARAGVTKGAFFHYFQSKEAAGIAVATFWGETTSAFFAQAPYHASADPVDRILAYVAFRRAIITDDLSACSCLAGTLVQEVHATSPRIREACAEAMLGHAASLEADMADAIAACGVVATTAQSLARHTQTVIQGAFVVAKAANDPELARDALDHLDRYLRLLFHRQLQEPSP
jgi:TetR/AcrR family transcriptional regulator, transcriptional repressor for nem operon